MKRNMGINYDYIFESTGRKLYLSVSGIGIDENLSVTCGYDDGIRVVGAAYDEKLLPEERKELGEYMINLWQQFIEKGNI